VAGAVGAARGPRPDSQKHSMSSASVASEPVYRVRVRRARRAGGSRLTA